MANKLILAIILVPVSLPCQAYYMTSWVAPAAARPVTQWSHSYISQAEFHQPTAR